VSDYPHRVGCKHGIADFTEFFSTNKTNMPQNERQAKEVATSRIRQPNEKKWSDDDFMDYDEGFVLCWISSWRKWHGVSEMS